jgi:hypothetical protein
MNKPPAHRHPTDAVVHSLLFCAYFALIVYGFWQGTHSPGKAMYTLDTRLTPNSLFGLLVLADWAGLAYYNGRLGDKTLYKTQLAMSLTLIFYAGVQWGWDLIFGHSSDLTVLSVVWALILYLLTMALYAPVLGFLTLIPAVRTAAQGGFYNLGLYALVGLICASVCVLCYITGKKSTKKRAANPVSPEEQAAEGGSSEA